ncbi:substrate-binding periplasmic protein [Chromobacterium haemolyticum]|uniref:substrate-binding periplasmic protein n=1 Tax=Chromobacterium haemolyticum TaxID=394935 RepID=UPI0015936E77|nr:transporter substrate-binding domain-containing protein [Chromobacterium haemolyticum]
MRASLWMAAVGAGLLSAGAVAQAPVKLCGVEWQPFTYVKNGKVDSGISHDVLQEAFRRMNVPVTMEGAPWERCLRGIKTGDYDAVIDNEVAAQTPRFKNVYSSYPVALCVKRGSPVKSFDWKLVQGQTVGMVRGYTYTPKILNYPNWKLEPSNDEDQLYAMLTGGHRQFVLCDVWGASLRQNVEILQPVIDRTDLSPTFSDRQAALAARLDATIGDLIRDGSVERIYAKYTKRKFRDMVPATGK